MDIATISTQTLEQDLLESKRDISACELALLVGVDSYSGGSVAERLDANKHFVKVISEELDRRVKSGITSRLISHGGQKL